MKTGKILMFVATVFVCLETTASADIRGIPDAWILDDLWGIEDPYPNDPYPLSDCNQYPYAIAEPGYWDYETIYCSWYGAYECTEILSTREDADCCVEPYYDELYE